MEEARQEAAHECAFCGGEGYITTCCGLQADDCECLDDVDLEDAEEDDAWPPVDLRRCVCNPRVRRAGRSS